MSVSRRGLLWLPALAGCSVLPERPFQDVQRYALAPERPRQEAPSPRGPVLLVRGFRAAPGLESRGLRLAAPNGVVDAQDYNEWTAPPAELVEEAVRRWLAAAGLFAAVVAPGSRLRADVVIEGELLRLQAEPAAGVARCAVSALLLSLPGDGGGETRILGSFAPEATAPLPGGARPDNRLGGEPAAAGMRQAVAAMLERLEREVATALPSAPRPGRR